jgi:hypothetical protein
LKYLRELDIGTSLEGHGFIIPFLLPGPDDPFELMLYIKKPYPCRRGDKNDGKLDHQELFESYQKADPRPNTYEYEISNNDTPQLSIVHALSWESEPYYKQYKRGDNEKCNGIPVNTVMDLSEWGEFPVLLHREGHYITYASFIKVTDGGMVYGVICMPAFIRRKHEAAEYRADYSISQSGFEK